MKYYDKHFIKRKYENEDLVKKYDKTRFKHFQGKLSHLMEIGFINGALRDHNIKEILEIAPGTGRITKELIVNKYIGLDSSEVMLNELKKIKRKGFKFRKGNAFNLPFSKNSFECVLTFRLIRHFKSKDRKRLYKEVKRVLKKNGTFIFDALSSERGILGKFHDFFWRIAFKIVKRKEFVYDKYYKKKELIDEIKRNGFDLLCIDAINPNYSLYSPVTRLKLNFLHDFLMEKAVENNKRKRKGKKAFSWVVVAKKL